MQFSVMSKINRWCFRIKEAIKASKSKQITISRFGWSDIGQQDAHIVALKRIEEAFEQIEVGKDVIRKELRVAYNGSDGVPIREVVAKYDDVIITRDHMDHFALIHRCSIC